MSILQREYDLFGPWLLQITNQDEVPPLFQNYFTFNNYVKLAFKIPKNIERRMARPGDILYDVLVSLYDEEILILEHTGTEVYQKKISINQIIAIQNLCDLLEGEIKIYTLNKIYTISYNTVSEDMMHDFVKQIRDKYLLNKATKAYNSTKDITGDMLLLFKNLLNKITENEQVSFLNYQHVLKINKKKTNLFYHLYNLINYYILQASMYLVSKKELIIISKRKAVKRIWDVDYSHINTYIPFDCIKNIQIVNDDQFKELKKVIIRLGEFKLPFLLDKNTQIDALMKFKQKK